MREANLSTSTQGEEKLANRSTSVQAAGGLFGCGAAASGTPASSVVVHPPALQPMVASDVANPSSFLPADFDCPRRVDEKDTKKRLAMLLHQIGSATKCALGHLVEKLRTGDCNVPGALFRADGAVMMANRQMLRESGVDAERRLTELVRELFNDERVDDRDIHDAVKNGVVEQIATATATVTPRLQSKEVELECRIRHYGEPWTTFSVKTMPVLTVGKNAKCDIDVTKHITKDSRIYPLSRLQMTIIVTQQVVFFVDLTSHEGSTVRYGRGFRAQIAHSVRNERCICAVPIDLVPTVTLELGGAYCIEMRLSVLE